MSGVPVAALSALSVADRWSSCARCGMMRPNLQEVVRPRPHDETLEYRARWCGQCRGEQDPKVEPAGEAAEDGGVRRCPSCERDKPAAGWGRGLVGLGGARVEWVCADCKPSTPEDVTVGYPRFIARIALDSGQRRILADELVEVGMGHPVFAAIIGQLEAAGEQPGPVDLDVDVAGLGLADRSRVALALEAAIVHRHPSVHAVRRAWHDWLKPQLPTGRQVADLERLA